MPLPGLSGAAAERYGATPSSAGRPMPYKFNEPRRHKIPRARYRVQNWPEYDRALQRRGDLTVWVTPEAIAAWCPPRTGRRGRPRDYSDVAIETGHLLRLAFGRPWRQTEGLLRSLTALLDLELGIPDHTTFSRRSPGLMLAKSLAQARAGDGPVHVVIDATGLKIFGAGEWLAEKHGERGKRTWRKLHLAVDCGTGEILPCELTPNQAGGTAPVGPLLEQISAPLGSVIADGAYDGEPVYRAVSDHQPDPPVDVVIPPRSTAAPSAGAAAAGRLVWRGLASFAGPGGEASLCQGTGVLVDRLVGWVAIQVKADRMVEDGAAIGGAQLPRAQHRAGVGAAPVQCGGNERGEPGDQRPDLLRRF